MTIPIDFNLLGLPRLNIDEFLQVTEEGNSCPVIIRASDGKEYVLKTRRDGTLEDKNDYGIFIETLSYLILQSFGFTNIPQIVILDIDDCAIEDAKFRFDNSDNEREQVALANIINSHGYNLGVEWIDKCEIMTSLPSTSFLSDTINFDAWLMNADRTPKNPNILYCVSDFKHYLIDFGGAFEQLFAFYQIESDNALFEIPKFYNKYCFDDKYLFYSSLTSIKKRKAAKTKDEILALIKQMPKEWAPHKISEDIADIISQRIGRKDIYA